MRYKLAVQVNSYTEYLGVINYYIRDFKTPNDIILTEDWYNHYKPLFVCVGYRIHIKGFRRNIPEFGNELNNSYEKISYTRWLLR